MPDAAAWSAAERGYMRRALTLARRGWGRTAPNPMVGAVVVANGVIVGEGWHAAYGAPHAEPMALAAAGQAARGAEVYVTLEPCAHHGKTPPCADTLIRAGVRRVVIAMPDPNPVAAGGIARLRAAGIRVDVGLAPEDAAELNAAFLFAARGADRPWVTLKLATSLDGAIADHSRRPGWLTGLAARRAVHWMRANADAIAVGIGTVEADDPLLTVRHGSTPRRPPARVVFDRGLRIDLVRALFRTSAEAPVIVIAGSARTADDSFAERRRRLEDRGALVIVADDIAAGLRALRAHDVRHLFCEGGAGLAGALLTDGFVDRLVIFQAPVVLGAGALPAFAQAPAHRASEAPRWRVVSRRSYDDDLMTVYAPVDRARTGG